MVAKWKAEHASDKLGNLAEEISRQSVKGATCLLLLIATMRGDKQRKE
jgi:hypothetical protein